MRVDEIRGKDDADLEIILGNVKRELFDFRFKTATGESERPSDARDLRRTIARINTVLAERSQGIRGEKPHRGELS